MEAATGFMPEPWQQVVDSENETLKPDYKNSLNIESFFRFLEIVNTDELLTESLLESKDSLKYISFDTG